MATFALDFFAGLAGVGAGLDETVDFFALKKAADDLWKQVIAATKQVEVNKQPAHPYSSLQGRVRLGCLKLMPESLLEDVLPTHDTQQKHEVAKPGTVGFLAFYERYKSWQSAQVGPGKSLAARRMSERQFRVEKQLAAAEKRMQSSKAQVGRGKSWAARRMLKRQRRAEKQSAAAEKRVKLNFFNLFGSAPFDVESGQLPLSYDSDTAFGEVDGLNASQIGLENDWVRETGIEAEFLPLRRRKVLPLSAEFAAETGDWPTQIAEITKRGMWPSF